MKLTDVLAGNGELTVGSTDGYSVKICGSPNGCARVVLERKYTVGNDFYFKSDALNQKHECGGLNGKEVTVTASTPITLNPEENTLTTYEWSLCLEGSPAAFGLTLSGISDLRGKGHVEPPKYSNISELLEKFFGLKCSSAYAALENIE